MAQFYADGGVVSKVGAFGTVLPNVAVCAILAWGGVGYSAIMRIMHGKDRSDGDMG